MSIEHLQRHVYWSPTKQTSHPNNREDRLNAIIANIDRQQSIVRAAIIEDARSYQKTYLRSSSDADPESSENAMDIDSSQFDDEADRKAEELLYQNLNAPYIEGSGDQSMLPFAPDGTFFAPPPGVIQAKSPQEFQLAKETLEYVYLYEKTSCKAQFGRDYYVQALRRTQPYGTRSTSTGPSGIERRTSLPSDRRPSIGSASLTSPQARRSSTTLFDGTATKSPSGDPRRVRASPADPRIRPK
jgi:hypothetical protein